MIKHFCGFIVMALAKDFADSASNAKVPDASNPTCIVVLGMAGSGKSSLVQVTCIPLFSAF